MLGKLFHVLASIWTVGPVKDTQCGFKGFTRAAAQDLFARQQILSIVFDVELIFLARKRGYEFAIVPIRWSDKRGSRMRASPGLALQVTWDLFRIPLIHRRVARRVEPASLPEPPTTR
jgi:dolichyl-phosphate beta-glucosyltransferase